MLLLAPFLKLLSLFPLRVLYGISDVFYFFLFHIFAYRRMTVRRNLSLSFPDHTGQQIREIERGFYRHFADLMAESVKSFSISEAALEQRVTVSNMDLVQKFMAEGKSICGVLGHMGNWEWAVLRLARLNAYPTHALYQPSSSKRFDRWLKHNRERFGALLVSTRDLRPVFRAMEQGPVAIGVLGDQGPVQVDKAYWTYFMHQPTAVFRGPARMVIRHKMAMFYLSISKLRRGHYHIDFELIADQADSPAEDQLTETYIRRLETDINRQPEIWLWSHRRWKRSHLKPANLN